MSSEESALLSVVIPTYDRNDALQGAIESVVRQTYSNIELLLIDDGSPTPVQQTVETPTSDKIAALRVIRHDENRGANVARNAGIREASGEYIAFLDDDDRWRADKAERVVDCFETASPEVGVVYTGTKYEQESMSHVARPTWRGNVMKELLTGKAFGQFSSIAVQAEIVPKAGLPDERFPTWQDREWLFRLAQCCHFEVLSEPLTIRRIGAWDHIGNRFEKKRDISYPLFVEKHYPVAQQYGRYYARMFLATLRYNIGATAIRCERYSEARRFFLWSFLTNPLYRQCHGPLVASLFGERSYRLARYLKQTLIDRDSYLPAVFRNMQTARLKGGETQTIQENSEENLD